MRRTLTASALLAALVLALPSAHAQQTAASVIAGTPVTVEIDDQSPRFLAWYDAAKAAPDANARWELWQKMYGEAAVPPTAQGREMAHRLVDSAWPRYESALPAARAGAARLAPGTAATLNKVAALLGLERPSRIRVKTIVSGFENNAYAFRADVPVLVLPLESTEPDSLRIAHEGTHAVHMLIANLGGQWERSVAATALQEGLAMHASCEVMGGNRPEFECVGGMGPDGWAAMNAKRAPMLEGVRQDLAKSDAQSVAKYTYGMGNTGQRREAYAIGWWVVAQLRKDGMTLAQIAHVKEADMPAVVEQAVAKILAAKA